MGIEERDEMSEGFAILAICVMCKNLVNSNAAGVTLLTNSHLAVEFFTRERVPEHVKNKLYVETLDVIISLIIENVVYSLPI